MRRTFILHASGSKLPSDLLGLTSVRYDPATSPAEVRAINQKLRKAIETEGRRGPVEGLWWQLSLTMRSEEEPSAVSLLRISRDRDGGLNVTGRSWQEDGTLSARYWSEAAKERRDPASIFYFWKGRAPSAAGCPAARGHRRDQGGDRRPRHRVLDDTVGSGCRAECPNRRRLPSSRPLRSPGAGGWERGRARPAHHAAPRGVEVGRERILRTDRVACTIRLAFDRPRRDRLPERASGRRYVRSPSEGAEIASTSSPVFFSSSLRAMSAWATMPTSLPFSTTASLRTGGEP